VILKPQRARKTENMIGWIQATWERFLLFAIQFAMAKISASNAIADITGRLCTPLSFVLWSA